MGVRSRWLGLAGLDVSGALGQATTLAASPAPTCPPIREALPAFLAHQVEVGEIRASTASAYRNRLAVWAYPLIGDVPWDRVSREQIGAILLKIRAAKKSMAVLEGIRCPLTRFYQWQANVNGYRGA